MSAKYAEFATNDGPLLAAPHLDANQSSRPLGAKEQLGVAAVEYISACVQIRIKVITLHDIDSA